MAKLGSYYGLCPLIDQVNLQGISEDRLAGHVIVTLGKNIAIRYKLSDQKQAQSWRTKDKFTSPVIYDKEENKYFAVFNHIYVRTWEGDEEHLDKLKKYKFNKKIRTMLSCGGKSFVVFENGFIVPLKVALENRKDLDVENVIDVNSEEIIDNIDMNIQEDVYIGLIVKSGMDTFFIWTLFLNGIAYQQFDRIHLNRSDVNLVGYVMCKMHQRYVVLFTLWSDAKLYSRQLTTFGDETPTDIKSEGCGEFYTNIQSVSCNQFVAMMALNNDYIGMYGAECNQEGACLIVYNVQFKVSQSKQVFKMFSNATKMWRIENNLLLCASQNLAVVPFYLNTEQLAALIGSHKVVPNENDCDVVYNLRIGQWDIEDNDICLKAVPDNIKRDVVLLLEQGLSETVICEHLIGKYIESKNLKLLETTLDYFEDISDSCIAKLLRFSLSVSPICKDNLIEKDKSLQPECALINKILEFPCNDVLLLPHMRKEFEINDTIMLLQYICHLLSEDDSFQSDGAKFAHKLIDWGCVLLDATYQKFFLTHDDKIIELLNDFRNIVQQQLDCVNSLKYVHPILEELTRGNLLSNRNYGGSSKYSIEYVDL